jgi:hypothetical protein
MLTTVVLHQVGLVLMESLETQEHSGTKDREEPGAGRAPLAREVRGTGGVSVVSPMCE